MEFYDHDAVLKAVLGLLIQSALSSCAFWPEWSPGLMRGTQFQACHKPSFPVAIPNFVRDSDCGRATLHFTQTQGDYMVLSTFDCPFYRERSH
eukprot:2365457-Pleurochrysis_carterae.AAC.1